MEHKVRRFTYDGFGGHLRKGYTNYTIVALVRWTLDPGVGEFECSDGQIRMLPSFAIEDLREHWKRPEDAPSGYSPIGYVGRPLEP